MTLTRISPKQAMDYPNLPEDQVVIWRGNEFTWPDARRELRYLTDKRTDPMKGYALSDPYYQNAVTFPTREAAEAWLRKQEALRGSRYPYTISTVGELIQLRFSA